MASQPPMPDFSKTIDAVAKSGLPKGSYYQLLTMHGRGSDLGRQDDWSAWDDMSGIRRTMGAARYGGASVSNPFVRGTGSVALRPFGSGGTPSNPGAYNWQTLGTNVGKVATGVATAGNLLYDKIKGIDTANMKPSELNTTIQARGMFATQTYRNMVRQSRAQQRLKNIDTAKQMAVQQQQTASQQQQYANMYDPGMNYAYSYAQQLDEQMPLQGPQPAQATQPAGRKRGNAATVKFNPKTGQRETKSGLVIPSGTTSV